jgi:predicted phage-related endonuclease
MADINQWLQENELVEHDLIQGTQAWSDFRLEHDGASEAAVMLGISDLATRTELLDAKSTGISKEFSEWVQEHILDNGHRVEAMARPLIEQQFGIKLYPVVYSRGKPSASCDGITMSGSVGWEHKQWNTKLAEAVAAGNLPEKYMAQPQQCLLLTGAEKWIFTVSDGTEENMVSMEIHPDQEWFARILDGWAQFNKDRETHVPKVIAEKPKAEVVIELPALFVHAKGEITESNMKEFGIALATRLEEVRAIKLVTDQDFANAKGAATMFREQIQKLKQAKEAMLSQTVTIGEAARMIDAWSEDLRVTALQLEKDVEREDLAKKRAMVDAATVAFNEHVAALEAETKPTRLNIQMPNFAGEIKGKRNYASMQDAIDTALANAKISADAIAQDVRSKLAWCKANAEGYGFLFSDMQQIIFKATDDFQLLVSSRIDQHKKAEEAKLEAEREKIRAEEEAKAKAAADEAARKAAAELAAKQVVEAAATQSEPALAEAAKQVSTIGMAVVKTSVQDDQVIVTNVPIAEVIDTGATMKLGQISELLGFSVTSEILHSLGIESVGKERAAILYREADFPRICACLIANLNAACVDFIEGQRKAA